MRTDGLRIAVEVTATTGKNLDRKIESYAHMFRNAAPRLAVVFVVTPSMAPNARSPKKIRARVLRHRARSAYILEHQLRAEPLPLRCRRVGRVVPGPRPHAERFLTLAALQIVDVRGDGGWTPTACLDARHVQMDLFGPSLAADAAGGWLRLAELAKLRGSTPHWLRGPLRREALEDLDGWVLAAESLGAPARWRDTRTNTLAG
jgi:hypothetical protein